MTPIYPTIQTLPIWVRGKVFPLEEKREFVSQMLAGQVGGNREVR